MKLLSYILLLSLSLFQCITVKGEDKWYSLGNYIEEEGTNDLAGTAVAQSMDGTIIAISSPHYVPENLDAEADDDDYEVVKMDGQRYGRIAVYTLDLATDEWTDFGDKIVGNRDESLGISMDMTEDGRTIVVGKLNDHGGNRDHRDAGGVSVYTYENGEWIPKGKPLFGDKSFDRFGASVDISNGGVTIAVGIPGRDVGEKDGAGAVIVYEYDITTQEWMNLDGIIEGKAAYDHFGSSVSLSQTGRLAIGAPNANLMKGAAYMYKINGTNDVWEQMGTYISGDKFGDKFGASVAMSYDGSTVVVGSPIHTGFGNKKRSGSAAVYKFRGGDINAWQQVGVTLIGRGAGDEFGTSVDISDDGNEIVVGSPFSNTLLDEKRKTEAGHITAYHYRGGDWEKRHLEIEGKKEFSHLGSSVAVTGDGYQVIGGAPTEGYASVYGLSKTAPPTMSPTPAPKIKSASRGFAFFMLLIFILVWIIALGLLCFNLFMRYREKQRNRAGFEQPDTDPGLEMNVTNNDTHNNNDDDDDGSERQGII